jgi:hypothetical protein
MFQKAALFMCVFLVGCSADPKLVNFELPTRPQSCTERPKELSKKDVKRDLDIVEAVDWHIDDRIKYAKERAKWIDCQRFLKRTWQNMRSK